MLCLVASRTRRKSEQTEFTNPGRQANALYDLFTDPEYQKFSFHIVPCYRTQSLANITGLHGQSSANDYKYSTGQLCHFPELSGDVSTNENFYECPWRYKIDYNEFRIPRTIAMVECECRHCHRGRCMPVFSYLPVLHEECDGNMTVCKYQKAIVEVAVGCACLHHRLATKSGEFIRRHPCRPRIVMKER